MAPTALRHMHELPATLTSASAPRSSTVARATAMNQPSQTKLKVALIGITGGTGRGALKGLLSVAKPHHTLVALTRDPESPAAQSIKAENVQLVKADLDDPASLRSALEGTDVIYCHALSKDAAKADPVEVVRARTLAQAAKQAGVANIIYNSAGGRGCGYGISQMDQKHQVEDIIEASGVKLTALEATLFMEELWKRYTRPGILQGKFSWSTPGDRPIQLLAARDLGLAAGHIINDPSKVTGSRLELAADELTPVQMAQIFSEVQRNTVEHKRAPAWPFWFIARDVFRISRFLSEYGYRADVQQCKQLFPGMLSFRQFLEMTQWADPTRTYEQGIEFRSPAQSAAQL